MYSWKLPDFGAQNVHVGNAFGAAEYGVLLQHDEGTSINKPRYTESRSDK